MPYLINYRIQCLGVKGILNLKSLIFFICCTVGCRCSLLSAIAGWGNAGFSVSGLTDRKMSDP